ncbi:hypothetical protein A3A20_02750 [Candidatus Wolfebacteria bacterium RIFCSPLOWO2_01_FULL_45_19]|uniref:Uncharacterized protein n=1 Tax=Candidatus Wolfebacteria bacterium RIFCSPLOWO2_01_FULL_45_19 TaxID=1802557 RepID=A0A1F8DST9_9BACT|nr:MAG: hypothetical protein UX23_C0005G0044 [Parcubacteria group bacterium GW2011_GWB1_45_9]OGM91466.1 MAG: hypothetical protein A3A20_02750 [Candidatus Wolfebacteria bacterium RIFCSPLOWO2_01_FULL_45_19]
MIIDHWRRVRNGLTNEYLIAILLIFFTATANWLFPYYYAVEPVNQSFGVDFESFGGPVSYDLSTGYQDGLTSFYGGIINDGGLDFGGGLIDGSSILNMPNL